MYFVNVYSCNLLELFPQHGDGLKYKRDIKLEKFQYDIIDDVQLIKGLIHSDGCLYKANNKGYISFFYNFTNMSKNIIDILCGSLDNININYKINKHKNDVYLLNIYKQKDFIKLYSLIGTKNLKQIDEINEYIQKISNKNKNITEKISKPEKIKSKNYCSCGKEIDNRSKSCQKCNTDKYYKVKNRPTKDELRLMISDTSLEAVGRVYGVSGNAVKKWLK